MHIKSMKLSQFRGFTDLTLQNIPPVKLVMLIGPNGTGKSSIFDALLTWSGAYTSNLNWDPTFHNKQSSPQPRQWNQSIEKVELHEGNPPGPDAWKKLCYFRSAYRNEAEFSQGNLGALPDLAARRFTRTIENDAAVSANYRRLIMQTIRDVWGSGTGRDRSLEQYANAVVEKVNASLSRVLPHLRMESLGDPGADKGNFYFTKGISKLYLFKNLSGGEKAVFDMLIDLITKSSYFDDSIICIDEPESHVNPAVHGPLLAELLQQTPERSQLWIATHAIGMLRHARDLESRTPGTVAFINFEADFDQPVIIGPTKMDRPTWQRSLHVALDDLSALVAPRRIVICEGGTGERFLDDGLDSEIFGSIFGPAEPDTQFFSAGSHAETEKTRNILATLAKGVLPGLEVRRLIDRDDRSDAEVAEARRQGNRVLTKRNLESYLFSDEVLRALATKSGVPDAADELIGVRDNAIKTKRGRPDDFKNVAGETYRACKDKLGLISSGNNTKAFMRDTLAPLIHEGTETFQQLHCDIFG